jgi:hypothetical protein
MKKKRNGRPPLDPSSPTVSISVRLPSKQFDRLCIRAIRAKRSVGEQMRRELRISHS